MTSTGRQLHRLEPVGIGRGPVTGAAVQVRPGREREGKLIGRSVDPARGHESIDESRRRRVLVGPRKCETRRTRRRRNRASRAPASRVAYATMSRIRVMSPVSISATASIVWRGPDVGVESERNRSRAPTKSPRNMRPRPPARRDREAGPPGRAARRLRRAPPGRRSSRVTRSSGSSGGSSRRRGAARRRPRVRASSETPPRHAHARPPRRRPLRRAARRSYAPSARETAQRPAATARLHRVGRPASGPPQASASAAS